MSEAHPATPQAWEASTAACHALLTIHSARLYGLVTGRPVVDAERCVEILQLGERAGVSPSAAAIEDALRVLGAPSSAQPHQERTLGP